MPSRIQRKRTPGWRMPEGAIYVGRPSKWGNPFTVSLYRTPAQAVRRYRRWITGSARRCEDLVPLLRGHDLVCWCPLDQPCHADVLLELANQEAA